MIKYNQLHQTMTGAFIAYQYRIDFPFPYPEAADGEMFLHYQSNPIFKAKVDQIVAGVMQMIIEAEELDERHM